MSCVNFKTKEKNNKWREVALDLEKEKSIPKYFGVDTETRVDELLQNNITLFDWIRKNQGFPYFIGRRINGENALTSEEMSFISSNGSKTIPILTAVTEKSAKDNAKIAITLLEDLKIERNTPVFVEIDAEKVTDEFLKEFATEVLSGGYIPGFYVDTDSYNNFDRLFSRAYQANEELMKQCKIWALSPEMEEFYETKNGHNEKPDIWGPFAPSCISKEQISFWQYGRKCHPINTYKGDKAYFNLNLTIEPSNVFSVSEAKVVSYNFAKDKNYNFEVCVTDGDNIETVNLNCDFIKAKSNSLLVNDKIYAKNINSSHNILEFVICQNNDVLSSKTIVIEGTTLIKFAFISKESSRVYHFEKLVSLEECELFKDINTNSTVTENEEEIQKVSAQEIWFTKFVMNDTFNNDNGSKADSEQTDSIVENYMYKAHEDIFSSEIINVSKMRSSVSGDDYNIFATIPQSAVKRSGSECCTLKDVYGRPTTAYYKDTLRDYDGTYISKIAIWSLNPVIDSAQNADRLVEFTYQKAYNALTIYNPSTDIIQVMYCDNDRTYVSTSQTQISLNLVGCHTAYINRCSFEVCTGGNNTNEVDLTGTLLGVLKYPLSIIADVYSVLSTASDIITNYNLNQAENEYVLYPECGMVTKQVGSTYQPVLGFKNAFLKIRCTLDNVTIYPTSKLYYQVETKVLSTFNGGNETIYLGGSEYLQ